jgi:hypothetical protein
MEKKKKEPKVVITDGGVEADITCFCGNTFHVSVWGAVYERTKEGRVIKPREYTKDTIKCKCGREYIFVPIPDVAYKILNEAEYAEENVREKISKEL